MGKMQWYLRRLSVMRPREVLHRVLELARVKWLHISYLLGFYGGRHNRLEHGDYRFCISDDAQLPSLPLSFDLTSDLIQERLAGKHPALGFQWSWTEDDLDWHKSPDTGRLWPRLFFDRIDYRQGNPYGDVRVVWEPSRLQQLVELALIASNSETDRERAILLLTRQLESWVRANPPGCGIHYISVMECGLRLIAVCHALDIARPYLGDSAATWHAATIIVSSHADLIRQRLSLHSSSGNHTIAECAGLVYAGLLFPEMKGSGDWLETGISILREEAGRQVLADGGGIERSPWYHQFVLDLLGLVDEVCRFKGKDVPVEITAAVKRGRRFTAVFAQSPAGLPRQGDADDGYALSPYLHFPLSDSLESEQVSTFPDYGITSVALSSDRSGRLLLDHGPLGMEPSYGHGHADALSLVIMINGQELLVDTGTFSYTGEPEWRSYFRSTRAHNTVCIDGLDQAQQTTAFQWSKPYMAELAGSHVMDDGVIYLRARHNGYASLGIEHVRCTVIVPEELIIVFDQIEGQGQHKLDLNWHLALEPLVDGETLSFDGYGQTVLMRLWGGDFSLHRGETNPICGWRSPNYGIREPITTVRKSYNGKLPCEFVTTIELNGSSISRSGLANYIDRARSWEFSA